MPLPEYLFHQGEVQPTRRVRYGRAVVGFPASMSEDEIAEVLQREEQRAEGLARLFQSAEGEPDLSSFSDVVPPVSQSEVENLGTTQGKLDAAARLTGMVPGVGDVAGLAADAHMYATDEGSRNWLNYVMTAAGMLPFVPAASQAKKALESISRNADTMDLGPLRSGEPIFSGYGRNTTPAPDMGSRFGQDIEPAGRYMRLHKGDKPPNPDMPNLEVGQIGFERPLVVDNDNLQWKKKLSEAYGGKTGEELSKALAADGFDGIVTLDYAGNGKPYTSEAVDLSMFSPAKEISDRGNKITAYHGSPHDFDKFSMDAIGTGEGAQAYGHGLYFAESEDVAGSYRDALTREAGTTTAWRDADGRNIDIMSLSSQAETGDPEALAASALRQASDVDDEIKMVEMSPDAAFLGGKAEKEATLQGLREFKRRGVSKGKGGAMYQVEIDASPDELLDWDAPLSEQPEKVRESITSYLKDEGYPVDDAGDLLWAKRDPTGSDIRASIQTVKGEDGSRQAFLNRGIKGIKYKDGFSRGTDGGTSNYVIFDDRLITISKKYGVAIPVAAAILARESGEDTDHMYQEAT